jgi:hypothetical protein
MRSVGPIQPALARRGNRQVPSRRVIRMEPVAAVAFGAGLLLLCLFWIYGYIRRRSKKRL